MQIRKSAKIMISLLATIAAVYLLFCILLYAVQRHLIFFPTPEADMPNMPYIVLDTGAVRVKVWTLNPGRGRGLLYFGGNAENVADSIPAFASLFPDRTVYLVNYRGFGGSSGTPDEAGLEADALLAYDYFAKKHRSLAVMGRSIGSAVAAYVASERPVEKLILVTPFDTLENVACHHYPWLPVGVILKDRYDTASLGLKITTDTLIVATTDDEVIPYRLSRRLGDTLINASVQRVELSEVGHNTVHLHPAYGKILSDFLRR